MWLCLFSSRRLVAITAVTAGPAPFPAADLIPLPGHALHVPYAPRCPVVRENAGQGVTRQPDPSVLLVMLAALQEGKQPWKAQPNTKRGQRGQTEWFHLRHICSLRSLLGCRELSCACQQQGHHSTQFTQSHPGLLTGASPFTEHLRAKRKEDEDQQDSGEFLSQTGPCQDIFICSRQDKTHLIPCSLLNLQPPEQPLPQPAREQQEEQLSSEAGEGWKVS